MHQARSATNTDCEAIREVYRQAFPEGESELVSRLAVDLLGEKSIPRTISLVAETGGAVTGHVAFSPVHAQEDEGVSVGYLLAPLAVDPAHQRRGIGSHLVTHGLDQLKGLGVTLCFVYGDPRYYERFGFRRDLATPFSPPYPLQHPEGWQTLALNAGAEKQSPGARHALSCVKALRDPKYW